MDMQEEVCAFRVWTVFIEGKALIETEPSPRVKKRCVGGRDQLKCISFVWML